ncbi:gluconokinase [Rubrolithibacter danxiaensis]|uniref:gluconokinase n=1 Tax=Rubrolithibacter danxiaensis TaxID=3390805 RepID=UPI003BF912E8
MQDYFLGIDIGSGSTKAVAVDLNGKPVADSQIHYSIECPYPGYSEQDPETIWGALTSCIRDLLSKTGKAPRAVCFSSAMHSVIPVNEKGEALAKMMTWADGRSVDIADRLKESAHGEPLYRASGTPLHPMSPLCKIIWIREHNPTLFEQTHKFISIKEYIWYKLFNEFCVDYSIATATGLFDIEKLSWNKLALEIAGITESQLSVPVDTDYSAGGTNFVTRFIPELTPGIPFIIGASDGCLANLGSFATEPGKGAVTIGTSGAVRIASDKPIFNYSAMTFNYLLKKNKFICGGAINNGGNAVQWYIKNILNEEALSATDYESFFQEAATVSAGSEGLIFLPYIIGERAPIWDVRSSGTFLGITSKHGRAHFSRAVLEGICFSLKDVLESLEKSSENVTELYVSGGFVNSGIWTQMLADVTGKQIRIAHSADASAIGAAYLGMESMGIFIPMDNIANKTSSAVIYPSLANTEIYNTYFRIFKSIYPTLKQHMHQLNDLKSKIVQEQNSI